ncbi:hypothetical protein B0H34DRAFT_440237 [Crassisporium funariophilum]|nr:hypothetical protein B0H34DRAFT_440237 [Crassisporium funariophilum]
MRRCLDLRDTHYKQRKWWKARSPYHSAMAHPARPPRFITTQSYGSLQSVDYNHFIDSSPVELPLLRILVGSDLDSNSDAELVMACENNAGLVPPIGAVFVLCDASAFTQARKETIEQGIPNSVTYCETRIIDRERNTVLNIVQEGYGISFNTHASLFIPIDLLDDDISASILALPHIRTLGLLQPTSPIAFVPNVELMLPRAIQFLDTIKPEKLVFPADFCDHIGTILHACSFNTNLHTIEILQPTIFEVRVDRGDFIPRGLFMIEESLLGGLEHFHQLQSFTIPLELITPLLLFYLARLPRLSVLQIKNASNEAPGPIFLARLLQADLQQGFSALRELNIGVTAPLDRVSYDALKSIFHAEVLIL